MPGPGAGPGGRSSQFPASEIRFTHVGLVPDYECFDVCDVAWSFYIQQSLRSHITSGAGQPNASPGERNDRDEAAVSPA